MNLKVKKKLYLEEYLNIKYMKFRKLRKVEKFALIPIVGIYWNIKYDLDFHTYQVMWCFMCGLFIGKLF